ncbi:hypothetical protein CONPUDRAFT_152629 [Coniophora puteana RWD-64-598 SS2]|uniref:Osmotin thaumatin-like protein n=1 Tax=Coniophora puteana (strain RWD-64-598) TaxID=741705 RepID=A0A5M3MRJ4_CONPW|nr:uncharacterized protein CONPUDRAFT_152629 [Coniophora puteana RWD-64-598 SS2]EIW81710.1 hypothetical protein CONPUDRAFT_152629 [Coniophora puteana RWD-64-598 SS2]
MPSLRTLVLAATVASDTTTSVMVKNQCTKDLFLNTASSHGTIDNNVAGQGCNSDGSTRTTRGPTWSGQSPFSRAELNFWAAPGKINTGDSSCDDYECTISSGCPVPGDDGSCYSPCCSSKDSCSNGALPANNPGCVKNAGPGPNSPFDYNTCPNAYAFPDNDGSGGYTPANNVDYTCGNTDVTITLCPGKTSSIPK